MNTNFTLLFKSLEEKKYKPFYIVDGEEPYYADLVTNYFEEKILQPQEKDFNLITLYGKDTEWAEVLNACRRYPMFAEKQVVILKDASQMKTLPELLPYLENPMPTTILLIEHRFKKLDGRSRMVKVAKDAGALFTSDKLKDDQVPAWIQQFGKQINFLVGDREAQVLTTYLGNDLQKIANEIEKVRINVPNEKELTGELIQKYIGISKEYSIFDMPDALMNGQKDKLYRMLAYCIANPKSAPMPLVIGTFYSYFNRLLSYNKGNASPRKIEHCILLLAKYNNMALGVDSDASDTELLKEMIGKLEIVVAG